MGLLGRRAYYTSFGWWVKSPGQTSWSRLLAEVLVRIPTGATCCKPLPGSYQLWTLHWSDIICALLGFRANKLNYGLVWLLLEANCLKTPFGASLKLHCMCLIWKLGHGFLLEHYFHFSIYFQLQQLFPQETIKKKKKTYPEPYLTFKFPTFVVRVVLLLIPEALIALQLPPEVGLSLGLSL